MSLDGSVYVTGSTGCLLVSCLTWDKCIYITVWFCLCHWQHWLFICMSCLIWDECMSLYDSIYVIGTTGCLSVMFNMHGMNVCHSMVMFMSLAALVAYLCYV